MAFGCPIGVDCLDLPIYGVSQRNDQHHRADLQLVATHLCGYCFAGFVRVVFFRPDDPASRLLRSCRRRRGACCATPVSCCGSERGPAAGSVGGDRGFGESTDADGGASDCEGWRTGERSRGCKCGPRPNARRPGGFSECASESVAGQHELGIGFRAGQHRVDDSRSGDGLHFSAQTIDSRLRAERNCSAFCDAHSEPIDIEHGKDECVAGDCASGDVRGVLVLGSGAVELRAHSRTSLLF